MKIPEQIVLVILVILVMVVGKACGYSEESIMSLVKFIIGFGIIVNAKFIIKKGKDIKEYAIKFSTKN